MTQKPSNQPTAPTSTSENRFPLGLRVGAGFVLAFLLIGGVGGWAATAQLNGAVIAQGEVAVDQNLKFVQHRDGGIISAIEIREGDRVEAGQVLFRLDDAQTRAELSILQSQLLELAGREARLTAERDGLAEIAFPPELGGETAQIARIVQGETRMFEGNSLSRNSRKQQLELGISQIEEEIAGLETQLRGKADEIALVDVEHARIAELTEAKLIDRTRIFAMSRERARLLGEHGEISSAMARARVRIGELRLQILAVDDEARTEAQREIGQATARISELRDRREATEAKLTRTDLRAPIAGIINELKVHTIGGVITPAEVLASIVPDDARLKIGIKFPPNSIDQIAVGQPVRIRFPAFNQRTTPEVTGVMTYVAAAATRASASAESHYAGDAEIGTEEMEKLAGLQLIPGMPAEIFVSTEARTPLSYLTKPLTDQFNRAMRER
ncbi:HlyD family type I secretion periplasmic adaptor subunit [uncultured Paracoccus sp.]|uniref:HlyD family type I secretion periplasmic adaptor subunit n=1 Tax=uncultured Paracoccus sp. TaxID=189685 RepID=UPI00261457EC|nr:HlyD family type I secretion periplasmic adaptor subunit [uncultured Paracoccus sp.]